MMQPGQVKIDNEKASLAYQVILVTYPTVKTVEALGAKTGGSKTSRGAAETQRPPTTRRKSCEQRTWVHDCALLMNTSR